MAKGKQKRSPGAVEIVSGVESHANKESDSGTSMLPNLDDSVFAGLRQKIEQKLNNQKNATTHKSNEKVNKSSKSNIDPKANSSRSAPSPKQTSNKGKKRDRNGDIIAREDDKSGKKKKSGKQNSKEKDNVIREEILALGGDKEDFELVAAIDSDSELEVTASSRTKNTTHEDSLRDELTKILEAAGQFSPNDVEYESAEESDEPEDGDGEEDEEDESADGISDDEEEQAPPKTSAKVGSEITKHGKQESARKQEIVLPKEYSKLIVPPRSDWYMTPLSSIPTPLKVMNALPRHLLDRVLQFANSLLEQENKMYVEVQQSSASSSHKFYSTIMSSGTLSDKISALTLAIQESPLHNTKALENLIGLGRKRSRAQAVEVLKSVKDMFAQGILLPSDRRLKLFANQPSLVAAFQGMNGRWSDKDPLPGGLERGHLIVWAFEHFLKEQYFEVLKILEIWCNDEIEFSRSRAVSYVYELLKEKPEQEANLLRLLVNKLGDPAKKIASRASYLLLQLEQAHPLMKSTIISAVEELLFRPGQSQHAKYYAIITLNQTVLSLKEEKTAAQLLNIYFSLFVVLLKPTPESHSQGWKKFGVKNGKKPNAKNTLPQGQTPDEEMRDKLVSAILTGVNRAYPFTSSDTEQLSRHIETLFRITHSSNFNTSIQALMLIQQLTSAHQVAANRFYRTLYESLLDPRVATSSKQALYLNLLYKALKNDLNVRRVKAFVKRIVQVLGLHQPSFICGVFYLIRELEKTFAGLTSLYDQPEDNESDEEVFRDVPDEADASQQMPVATDENQSHKPRDVYDPRKRDPEHSNAEKTCLWELLPFVSHYHPSVSVNAAHLLQHEPMSGQPDLTLHTLSHFLDRFVYRTPKASSVRGSSIMQPLAGADSSDRLVAAGKGTQHIPVNSEAFLKQQTQGVAIEDAFFHEYFNRLGKDKGRGRKDKKTTKDAVARAEEADEGLGEDEIWQALVNSRPDLEADEDTDVDLDMSDLESAMFDEDEEEEFESDGGVIFNDESDEDTAEREDIEAASEAEEQPAKSKSKAAKRSKDALEGDGDGGDGDAFDMDVSDDDAFIDSDQDLPSDLDLKGEIDTPEEQSRTGQNKRRKLKHLPTFASVEDYAALLAGEDEGI